MRKKRTMSILGRVMCLLTEHSFVVAHKCPGRDKQGNVFRIVECIHCGIRERRSCLLVHCPCCGEHHPFDKCPCKKCDLYAAKAKATNLLKSWLKSRLKLVLAKKNENDLMIVKQIASLSKKYGKDITIEVAKEIDNIRLNRFLEGDIDKYLILL